jgi:hypothetical protein
MAPTDSVPLAMVGSFAKCQSDLSYEVDVVPTRIVLVDGELCQT